MDDMNDIQIAVEHILNSLKNGGKLVLFGNGGSAAQASHLAAEFIGHEPPLATLALTTDTSALTAIANDFGFGQIFERQIRALCQKGDVVVGISTSWKSQNVIRGIAAAKTIGAFTIALTGSKQTIADLTLNVHSNNTQEIQEQHLKIGHIIFALVGKAMKS